ncbi:MAG TPA: protease pro-enzyme activation domain-containing protein, partial [Steroidobacteraceae bacterium]|nr:protease pro-enzyme activation domain-containing protein [Steroidobacteraceae bacterium]
MSTLARPEYDVGEADAALRMSGLQLVLAKTPAQEEALNKLIADQQDPRSPQYHHWLTPAEFGARFGASDATIAALSGWLQSQGLKVGRIPAGRGYLPFSGSKEQVEAALHTQIHAFNIKGARHYSNITDPSVPASFKGVIAAIGGLNDFHP